MALSASVLSDLIKSNLKDVGANGSNLQKLCDALGKGIVSYMVGAFFTTIDVGSVTGTGTGTGTGVTGLSASLMQDSALNTMASQGSNARPLMNAIMMAVVQHLGDADLESSDAPVFEGTGTIVVGSIDVTIPDLSRNLFNQMKDAGANGENLNNFCDSIATGIVTNILSSGTGTLTITGAGGTPTPGTGTGFGFLG